MKISKEIKRLAVDVVNAIILLCVKFKTEVLSLGIADIINIPIKGTNNNKVSNIL